MSNNKIEIPVIDIAPYLNGSDKMGVAQQIDAACRSIGFFMIAGHGIDVELMESIEASANRWFDEPLSTKSQTKAPFGLGYMGTGDENVALSLDESSKVKDYKESLNLVLPIRDDVWPDDDELRQLGTEYYQKIEALSTNLLRLFALALNVDEHFFDDKVDTPYTTLRLLNYPEYEYNNESDENDDNGDAEAEAIATRNAEHTDYGTLTLLWSNDSRGLQAKTRDGDWIDVIAPRKNLIVNIGDLMMNWTNDEWVSTLHRVVPHPETKGKRRFSMPFFHNPNPDALIECIASCHSETNPPKYSPMLAKENLERKVAKALGKEEKISDYLNNEDKKQE